MNDTVRFEIFGDIAVFRLGGHVVLERAIRSVSSAIESAKSQGMRKLMIVASDLEGTQSPGIGTRFSMSREWAVAAGGVVRMAVVAKPEMIDPHKVGVIVAKNFGASADVFVSEADAIAWLQGN
jgi:hypothetical protein